MNGFHLIERAGCDGGNHSLIGFRRNIEVTKHALKPDKQVRVGGSSMWVSDTITLLSYAKPQNVGEPDGRVRLLPALLYQSEHSVQGSEYIAQLKYRTSSERVKSSAYIKRCYNLLRPSRRFLKSSSGDLRIAVAFFDQQCPLFELGRSLQRAHGAHGREQRVDREAIRGPKNVFQISLRSGRLMPKVRSCFPKKLRAFRSRNAF
jgi:hypothetical protein